MRIRNWERFQHYRNRNPPWVKLHKQLLDNPEWSDLPDHAARLLVELWLLASEHDGDLPEAERIAFRVRRPSKGVDASLKVLRAKGFIEGASTQLATCLQDASTETEAEREKEAEKKRANASVREVFDYWVLRRSEALSLNGGPHPSLTAKRSAKIRARLSEGYEVKAIKKAVDACMVSEFHVKGGHLDIELICRDQGKLDGFLHREAPTERRGSLPMSEQAGMIGG